MNYKFHIIKKPLAIGLIVFLFIVMFILLVIGIGNIHYPALIIALATVLVYSVRKSLFWTLIDVEIQESGTNMLFINGDKILFSEIESYVYRTGHFLTSGISRQILFLFFRNKKSMRIIPCRSSKNVKHYDRFTIELTKRLKAEIIPIYRISIAKFFTVFLLILLISSIVCVGIWYLLILI